MTWHIESERDLYRDKWVHLTTADVLLPDGRHLDHRIIRTAAPGAGLVTVDEQQRVLLIWRHRFITDTYGWEIPQGSIREGENPADAAVRETEEETGWRPRQPIRRLVYTQPSPGIMTSEHHIFRADGADHIGAPKDAFESDRIDWVPLDDVRELIAEQHIVAGTTLVALLLLLVDR
ncbi:NUDIX hydrolase [Actinoplanes sp. NPDC049548]|uniref:NUDIX hydrolase n=1 Tax=Actinoplanes sp. NPDC049548 TaxID=3155152 RepID=UPI00342978D6